MQYLKVIIIYALRIFLRMLYIFSIDDRKFVFVAGTKEKLFICNPKYIFEYLYNTYRNKYTYIWCLENKKLLPLKYKQIKIVHFLSIRYILESRKYYDYSPNSL
jgi:CDP-glycerol glycerophosphotransferase (TagB/SpsB family)